MDFVNNVNLVAARGGFEFHVLAKRPDLLDAAVRGSVDLKHIHGISLLDLLTGNTLTARLFRGALLAIQGLGQNTCSRGFPHATGPREKKALRNTFLADRVLQGRGDGLLPHDLFKRLRSKFSSEDQIFQFLFLSNFNGRAVRSEAKNGEDRLGALPCQNGQVRVGHPRCKYDACHIHKQRLYIRKYRIL